jgi:alpha-N-arabinofuranosidase
VPIVRYPGGNFVSGYDWRDGIGPKHNRPVRLDLAWKTTETNQFGTDEFMRWCAKNGIEPMMAVNLGTGTPLDAAQLVEYCNHPSGTYYSNLRAANGSPKPYGVKVWCLGNEMDGPWQTCHMSAEDYAKKAQVTAKMMRQIDPSIKLVACGSSAPDMPTYPEWDRTVLDNLYEDVDYISMHRYYGDYTNDEDFFASFHDMNNFIKTIRAACDFVKAKHRSDKTMLISFDEWNVWDQTAQGNANWSQAPHILEDIYTMKHALVFGGMLNTLLAHCDRVDIACLAQLVNVIAPIFTEERGKAIKQTIYFPFEMVSRFGRGRVLNSIVSTNKFESKYGKADVISSATVDCAEDSSVSIFLVNYSREEVECEMELRSFGNLIPLDCIVLDNENLNAKNTLDNPDAVAPRKGKLPTVNEGLVTAVLSPLSYCLLRLKYEA